MRRTFPQFVRARAEALSRLTCRLFGHAAFVAIKHAPGDSDAMCPRCLALVHVAHEAGAPPPTLACRFLGHRPSAHPNGYIRFGTVCQRCSRISDAQAWAERGTQAEWDAHRFAADAPEGFHATPPVGWIPPWRDPRYSDVGMRAPLRAVS